MEKNFKKCVAFAIAAVMIFASTGFSFASQLPGQSGPEKAAVFRWDGLNTVTGNLSILSGNKANPTVRGTTYAGMVDYVNVVVSLKKNSGNGWSTIKSWDEDITISLNKFAFSETYKVSKNYSYKFTATVKSYKDDELVDSMTFDSKIVKY